jgi:competence protein ComEC
MLKHLRVTVFLLVGLVLAPDEARSQSTPAMKAHCIDVGQGDATLLEFPCGAVLIDAGGQDDAAVSDLVAYLDKFFVARPDLNKTLEAVFITHTHIDHNRGLQSIAEKYKVKRYIDNGMVKSSGKWKAKWIRDAIENQELDTRLVEVSDKDVVSAADPSIGFTNGDIDPIECSKCDPRIAILSASLAENPGWTNSQFKNQNNQGLVIRIDFGDSSFLFPGDMEEEALDTLVNYYEDQVTRPEALDVDVLHVGHHGSKNATTSALLKSTSPDIAVISMGKWTYGKADPKVAGGFNTWKFGHARIEVVQALESVIKRNRSEPVDVHVFERATKPVKHTVHRAIYATGWEGTVQVRATLKGKLTVTSDGVPDEN